MQRGADKWATAGFFGVTLDVLEGVYGHHHPDYPRSAVEAMETKLLGRTVSSGLKPLQSARTNRKTGS